MNADASPVRPWGYLTTALWAVVAFVIGQFAALAAVLLWRPGDMNSVLLSSFDGEVVTLFILISNPITVAVLAFAIWMRGDNLADYLALRWAPSRIVTNAIIVLVGLIALSDGLLFLSGHALVTPFQLQSFTTATAEGWLPGMLIAAILIAPAGEEIMFRGFLFRGFVRSERSAWPGIVVISIVWAALHIQYDWTGIVQILVVGLFLGYVRWRSGSVLLTFLLHALFNLEGTIETVLQMKYFS